MQLKSQGRFQLHSPSPGLFLPCLLMPLEIKENYSQWPTPTLFSSSAYFLLLEESDEQLQHAPEEDQSAFHWKKSFPEKNAEGAYVEPNTAPFRETGKHSQPPRCHERNRPHRCWVKKAAAPRFVFIVDNRQVSIVLNTNLGH